MFFWTRGPFSAKLTASKDIGYYSPSIIVTGVAYMKAIEGHKISYLLETSRHMFGELSKVFTGLPVTVGHSNLHTKHCFVTNIESFGS